MKQRENHIKHLNSAIEMRVDTICTKMGFDTEKSVDIDLASGSSFIDIVKLKEELDQEKKL